MARQSKRSTPTSVYGSDQRLKRALSHYLLTECQGQMGRLIERLAWLHERRAEIKRVRLTGDEGYFQGLVSQLMGEWQIKVADDPALPRQNTFADDQIYLPTLEERQEDLPMIVAFYIQECVPEGVPPKLQPAKPARKISMTLLFFLLSYPMWEQFDTLRFFVRQILCGTSNETVTLAEALRVSKSIPPARTRWAGTWGGPEPERVKRLDPKIGNILRTWDSRQCLEYHLVTGYAGVVGNELVPDDFSNRPHVRDQHVYQAMRNLYRLSEEFGEPPRLTSTEIEKISKCFQLRREGLPEEEVAQRLGFRDSRSYSQWTAEHHISIRFRGKDGTIEQWSGAKRCLLKSHPKTHCQDRRTLKLFKSDNSAVCDGQNYSFHRGSHFDALRKLVLEHKKGNIWVGKYAVFAATTLDERSQKSLSVTKWFLSSGGDPARFVKAGLLESDGKGNCRIPLDPDRMSIEQVDSSEDDINDE